MPNQKTRERKKLQKQQREEATLGSDEGPETTTSQITETLTTAAAATENAAPPSGPPDASTPEGERLRGVCRWYREAKRYGFISRAGSQDIFVHADDVNGLVIAEGDTLEYSVLKYNGKPKAVNVVKLNGPDQPDGQGSAPPPAAAAAAPSSAPPAQQENGGVEQKQEPEEAASPAAAVAAPAPAANDGDDAGPEENGGRIDNIRRQGTTQWFTVKKKHGFIKPDEPGQRDIFVHAVDLLECISEGDRVEYYVAKYLNRTKAIEVRKCRSMSSPAPSPAAAPVASSPSGATVPSVPVVKAPWGPKKQQPAAWANVAKGNKPTNGLSKVAAATPAAPKTENGAAAGQETSTSSS